MTTTRKSLFFIFILLASRSVFCTDYNSDILKRIDILEKEIIYAQKLQVLWRDTGELLVQAKEQHAVGNITKTQALLDQVEFQLAQSIKQSEQQSDISSLTPHYLKQ